MKYYIGKQKEKETTLPLASNRNHKDKRAVNHGFKKRLSIIKQKTHKHLDFMLEENFYEAVLNGDKANSYPSKIRLS